jgi:hypothetical protein
MLLLTACEPGSSETVVKIICPVIEQYDRKTQDQALRELEALPASSALRKFVGDYGRLREQIRVCRSRQVAAK